MGKDSSRRHSPKPQTYCPTPRIPLTVTVQMPKHPGAPVLQSKAVPGPGGWQQVTCQTPFWLLPSQIHLEPERVTHILPLNTPTRWPSQSKDF